MSSSTKGPGVALEIVPEDETALIDETAALTVKLLDRRYAAAPRFLRGVHPKDHGCVVATFAVAETLEPKYRVGLFKNPGKKFRSAIRFSNATALVNPDSLEVEPDGKPKLGPDGKQVRAHDSRGMAIKLYDVGGDRLVPDDGERTQDFLLINQPVFAFANIEDYAELNRILDRDKEVADKFFGRMFPPNPQKVQDRAKKTFGIVKRIQSLTFPKDAYQAPPLSPLDNRYFSAAPFLFGEGRVAKFSARPVNPASGELGDAIDDPDYLRNALRKRMAEAGGKDICFDFQVQVRSAESLAGTIEDDIEDACHEWNEADHPFVTVARITIPPQDVSSPERREFCETLVYTPWHGLVEHRPLGGINRLRRLVYEKSALRRGCPVSPNLPPAKRKGLFGFLLGLLGLK